MRHHRIAVLTVVGVLALAGCSAGAVGSADDAPTVAESDSGAFPGIESVPEDAARMPSAPGDGIEATADRQVISQGTVVVTAIDPIAAADEAVGVVEGAGGRVDSRTEQPSIDENAGRASAELIVRIPSAALTATLDAIEALGEVESAQLTQTDVTARTEDVNARITALQTSTDRLTTLLASAGTTKDLIDIESSLSERQGELEALQAQQRALSDDVQFATVSLAFGSEESAPVDTPDTFLSGLASGWDSLVGFTSALLVAFGVALPWLLVLGVIGAAALLVSRRRRPATPATATMEE